MSWAQLKQVRDWQTSLLLIARQEMAHLGIVCNLLTSIGGTPNFRRLQFPVPAGAYGSLKELHLTPFSEATLQSFIDYEAPDKVQLQTALRRDLEEHSPQAHEHLGQLLERLCVELGWEYAEVHAADNADQGLLAAARPHDHATNEEIHAGLMSYLGAESPQHALVRQALESGQTQTLRADSDLAPGLHEAFDGELDRAAAIPVIDAPGEPPRAVLLFLYRGSDPHERRNIRLLQQMFSEPGDLFPEDLFAPAAAAAALRAPRKLEYATLGGFLPPDQPGLLRTGGSRGRHAVHRPGFRPGGYLRAEPDHARLVQYRYR